MQWLRLCASTAGGAGSIPGQGTKIPHAALCGQRKNKKAHIIKEKADHHQESEKRAHRLEENICKSYKEA